MVPRTLEKQLRDVITQFPVIVILGPRQAGKTTLAKRITPFIKKQTIHLDLENPSDFSILEENPENYFDLNKDKCIIIDEVQRLPSLFPRLRPIIDNYKKPGRFILLGSANPTILKGSSESLAGRVVYMELTPFHLLELSPTKDMLSLWLRGGFPEPFLMKSLKYVKLWHRSFLNTYFERDLPLLGLNISPRILARTFTMFAHMQGGLCNISTLSRSLGIGRRKVEEIMQFFTSSYLLRELLPFYTNNKKRLIKTPKYYIRDSGLFHHTLHIDTLNDLWEHHCIGASWEGFIIEQIASLGLDLVPYFYRTRAGTECDLVLVRGNTPLVTIEAKISEAPSMTKSIMNSIHDLGTKENYIVVPSCKNPYPLKEKSVVCGLPWLLSTLKKKYD